MPYKPTPKLSDRLKYIRKLHNLSQAELADIAGTTQQAIQQAEKGKARQPRYLHKLSQALDIPVEWMVFGQQDHQVKNSSFHASGMNDKAADVLENFYAMPKKDQELIFELMQARKKK